GRRLLAAVSGSGNGRTARVIKRKNPPSRSEYVSQSRLLFGDPDRTIGPALRPVSWEMVGFSTGTATATGRVVLGRIGAAMGTLPLATVFAGWGAPTGIPLGIVEACACPDDLNCTTRPHCGQVTEVAP